MKLLQFILFMLATLAVILVIFDLVLYAVISIRNYKIQRNFMQTIIDFINNLPEQVQ
jgi:hypothetical protein